MRHLFCTSALVAASFAAGASAQAQTSPANAAAGNGGSAVLEELVVTAQRRTENLQAVPIAASVLSGDQLAAKAVANVADLEFAAPSLSITDAGETQSVNIRGIGISSNSPSASNGVATYIDGLFQPPIVTSIPFYDIAGIEVLRGPQGTLVGNNSTGGAIFVTSQKPQLASGGGYVQGGYGNFKNLSAEGAVNIPISDTFAVRIAGTSEKRDSYYNDIGPYRNSAGRLDQKGLRVGALWAPGRFEALLKVQLHERQSGGFAFRPVDGSRLEAFRAPQIRDLDYDTPTRHRERALISGLELRYEFDNGVTLRSLSGYQYKRINYLSDIDATEAPAALGGGLVRDYSAGEKQYSEEINIISPTTGALSWILGAYYQKNDIDVRYTDMPAPIIDILVLNHREITGTFAQVNYKIRPALELQVGLRYSTFEITGSGDVMFGRGSPGLPPEGISVADLAGAHKDDAVTGKVALNWTIDPDNLVYAFAARGYKPGGFNSTISEFDPEFVWNYEIGWKATLFDGHVRTQLDAFYNDYSGLQFDVLEPATGQGGIRNVASGKIKGVEAQVQGRFGGFGFDGSISYVHSELSGLTFVNTRALPDGTLGPQCPAGQPSDPPACFDYAPFTITTNGGPNLYSPKWSYNVGAQYEFELSGGSSLTPRLNYGYVASRYDFPSYQPNDRIAGRGIVSALLTYRHGDWFGEAYGTNLTNKDYVVGRTGQNAFYGAPREYGVRLGARF